ncbi:MAG: MFS transporter [Burkholderiales bacterium]
MSASERMSARELRAAVGLAGIFGLRMLGLFVILPVFALYAAGLEGGNDLTLVGIALGAYGLSQAILQIPFGRWSDRFGRKPLLYIGLTIFAAGSVIAGYSTSIHGVIVGRILQGSGAVSAVAMAMAADLTREEHRTKVMAIIGSMIGASFAASLVLGPWLGRVVGVDGIFYLTAILALAAMVVVVRLPDPPAPNPNATRGPVRIAEILRDRELNRLNVGIFALHAVLMSLFITVPFDLVEVGLDGHEHWKVYALVLLGSALYVVPALHFGDRKGRSRPVFLLSIAVVAASQVLLLFRAQSLIGIGIALLVFFAGFMLLEAALPAQVSRAAPAGGRGTAIAVYSTVQFLGASCGSAFAGYLAQHWGRTSLLAMNLGLMAVWLLAAWGMRSYDASSIRTYPLPPLDGRRAAGLRERLHALPGVREVKLQAGARMAHLKVDARAFDEEDVLKLIAGES